MKTNAILSLLAFSLMLSLGSCKKDDDTDAIFAADQQVSKDQNQADNEVEDVSAMQDDLMAQNEARLYARTNVNDTVYTFPFDSCATVTLVPKGSNATGSITVDYGTGCQGRDGRFRKGIVKWTYTDRLRKPGAVVTTTFQNYAVKPLNASEYVQIDNASNKITTNLNTVEVSQEIPTLKLRREVNMILRFSDNSTFSWAGTKNVEWNLGILGYRWDNVYTLKAGSQLQGTDRIGRTYGLLVNLDVVRKASCSLAGIFKPVSGQVSITHDDKSKVVDFGDGNCDNTVTITINGKRTRTRW